MDPECPHLDAPHEASHRTAPPVMRSSEPGEAWGYRYVDDVTFEPAPRPRRDS